MKPSLFFQTCALGLSMFLGTAQAQTPPNIVLIFVDDMGINDIGAYTYPTVDPYPASGPAPIDNTNGGTYSPLPAPNQARFLTPNIDSLATGGMKFTSFYAASPVCTPSRAGLMTGSYATRLQMESVILPSSNVYGIHSQEVTLAERLKQRGYATGIVGKWHLGDSIDFRPTRHGFDQFLGLTASHDIWSQNPHTSGLGDMKLYDGESPIASALTTATGGSITSPVDTNAEQSYLLEAFTERALSFIDSSNATGKPFFLYYAAHAPHVPCIPHPDFVGDSGVSRYYDVMMELDARVGQILAKLTALGIDNNTIVLFTSDNGTWVTRPGPTDPLQAVGSGYPYRGYKRIAQEGGPRVPLLVRYPGQIAAGSVQNGLASNIDLMPTLLSLAGGTIPSDRTLDGVNLWPLMQGQTAVSPRTNFFYYEENDTAAIGVRQADWKFLNGAASGNGLFDLGTDIQEASNVAGANSATNSSLSSALTNFNNAMVRRDRGLPQSNQIEIRKSAAEPGNTSTVPLNETGTATFEVRLAAAANATVTIAPFSGAGSLSVQSGSSLTFTTANFSTWQTVTLAAAIDANTTNDGATFRASSGLMHVREIFALETDTVSPPSTEITVSTSFAGTAAAPTGNIGFSSAIWASTAGGVSNSAATFTAGDIASLPTAYSDSGFTNTGNYIGTGTGGGTAQPAFQTLATAINVESATTTYFSFLYRVTAAQTNATSGGGFSFYSGSQERAQIGLGANQSIRINDPVGSSFSATANNSFITGTDTAWIVGKFVTGVGNDTVTVNVYTGTEVIGSEPVSWDATKSWTFGANIDTIRFNSPHPQQFDEFRMGTTYASVTAAPAAVAAPVINSSLTQAGTSGIALSYTITATNSPTSYSATGLPAGLGIDTATGVISGTPSASGTFNTTISATNSGGTGSANLVFTIAAVAPVVTPSQTATGTDGLAFSYQLLASGSPTSWALASGNLPAGITLDTATGLLSGTSTGVATYPLTFTATNAIGTSPAVAMTLFIAPAVTAIVYEPFAYTLGTNAPDPDGGLNSGNGLPATNNGGAPSGTSTGLRSTWDAFTDVVTGLTYTQGTKTFTTTGSAGRVNNATWGGNPSVYRFMATDPFLSQRIGGLGNGNFGIDGSSLFISFLGSTSSATADAFRLSFKYDGSANFYLSNTATGWSLNGTTATGVPLELNTPTLFVLRFDFAAGATDSITLWVNPALGTPLGSPNAVVSNIDFPGLANFQTRAAVANAMTFDELRIGTTLAAVTPFTEPVVATGLETFRSTNGLAADGSQDLLTPAGDGVANLLKYAFNMIGTGIGQASTLATPNSAVLSPAGFAGLPSGATEAVTGKLTITYIRRKAATNPGISYAVEFSETLSAWGTNLSATESATSIDTTFERVTITDSTTFTKRFVRVKVTAD